MFPRGDNIICGTSSSGTGTLTLAATPASIGALDYYAFATAMNGFANGKVLLIPYVAIEYSDLTFSVPVREETGIGTLTLGANIAATTLARTTIFSTGVVGGSYVNNAPTAMAIGTAANTLVILGQSASLNFSGTPYWETSLGDNSAGFSSNLINSNATLGNATLTSDPSGNTLYFPLILLKPVFAKVARIRVSTIYTGGTTTGALQLYQMGTNGRAGRLLVDFGNLPASPFNSGSVPFYIAATATVGMALQPGEYWGALYFTYSGGSGNIVVQNIVSILSASPFVLTTPQGLFTATGGASPAADPATLTGYAITALAAKSPIFMTIGPS